MKRICWNKNVNVYCVQNKCMQVYMREGYVAETGADPGGWQGWLVTPFIWLKHKKIALIVHFWWKNWNFSWENYVFNQLVTPFNQCHPINYSKSKLAGHIRDRWKNSHPPWKNSGSAPVRKNSQFWSLCNHFQSGFLIVPEEQMRRNRSVRYDLRG